MEDEKATAYCISDIQHTEAHIQDEVSDSPPVPISSYTESELSEYRSLLIRILSHYESIIHDTATFSKCSETEQLALRLCLTKTSRELQDVLAELEVRGKTKA